MREKLATAHPTNSHQFASRSESVKESADLPRGWRQTRDRLHLFTLNQEIDPKSHDRHISMNRAPRIFQPSLSLWHGFLSQKLAGNSIGIVRSQGEERISQNQPNGPYIDRFMGWTLVLESEEQSELKKRYRDQEE
jgi:hypothetical protein